MASESLPDLQSPAKQPTTLNSPTAASQLVACQNSGRWDLVASCQRVARRIRVDLGCLRGNACDRFQKVVSPFRTYETFSVSFQF